MAALVLSGLAALAFAVPGDTAESRGQELSAVVLTLAAPEAVAAMPSPPPQVAAQAPTPPAQPAPDPPLPDLTPPLPDAMPPTPVAMPDAPAPPDVAPQPDAPPVPNAPPLAEPQPKADPIPKAKKKPEQKAKKTPKKAAPQPDKARPAEQGTVASAAGDAGQTQKATRSEGSRASTADTTNLQKRWGATVRKKVEARKFYPPGAGRVTGTVTVRLTISRTGHLAGVTVARSSGNAALDQAAVKAVTSVGTFPAAPKGMTEASYTFTLPMKYAP